MELSFWQSLSPVLVEWGYPGLFIAAFLAGSILPFSSEVVLLTLVGIGVNPVGGVVFATLGNTLGTYTCYLLGYLGKEDWIVRYLKVSPERIEKTRRFLSGKGALMAFFTFLPTFGELIAITLGYMRANRWLTFFSMFSGKLIRYVLLLWAADEVRSLI